MFSRWSLRSLGTLAAFCLVALAVSPLAVFAETTVYGSAEYVRGVAPYLKQHCLSCHGAEKQKGGVRFDQLPNGFDPGRVALWTKVHEAISFDEMPPDKEPRPNTDETERVLNWIEKEQRATGSGSTRRLNRRELAAALRDVTGLDIDFSAGLPGDGKVAGFDTGIHGLQDAAASLVQVMDATRRAVAGIRFLDPSPSMTLDADLSAVGKDFRKAFDVWTKAGVRVKVLRGIENVGMLIDPKWVGDRGGYEFYVPVPSNNPGIFRLSFTVSVKTNYDTVPNPHLWVTIGGTTLDRVELVGTVDQPQSFVYTVDAANLAVESRGLKVILGSRVEFPYAVNGFENDDRSKPEDKLPNGIGTYRPKYDRKKTPIDELPIPFIVLHAIKVDSNYVQAWPPTDWGVDVGEVTDSEDTAGRLLAVWMDRAWRRPVSSHEQQKFMDLYRGLRANGHSFDTALRAAFHSVLLSGPFRYLASPADENKAITQHAIASRLSFMLNGTPPDVELRKLAALGKLRDAKVLDGQVSRLLADTGSQGFFHPFVMQWLEMDQPITVVMDHFRMQEFRFGRHLKDSMRSETIRYIQTLFAQNRPARELIHSDWTFMNNILARYYGYAGVDGADLRKVKLRPDDPRGGGILSHGGIQSMLTWMGDNWVIYRGAWTLRHVLDDPPPPPPLEVPELDANASENRGKPLRDVLHKHQEDPKCSVCHKTMDPLGFAFQNFDLMGRWRDQEYDAYGREELDGKIAWFGKGKGKPVDAAGSLPRGETFTSFAECKELMIKHYLSDIVRGVMRNLMIYATGRKPDVDDMAEIRSIMRHEESNGYPMGNLIKAVMKSDAFLNH